MHVYTEGARARSDRLSHCMRLILVHRAVSGVIPASLPHQPPDPGWSQREGGGLLGQPISCSCESDRDGIGVSRVEGWEAKVRGGRPGRVGRQLIMCVSRSKAAAG